MTSSRPYAEVIGDPIAHSKSPLIHRHWLGKLGLDADYRAWRVAPGELADYLAARRDDPDWRGCNVTMPHKQAILALLDSVDPSAAAIGAVNTVGRNADGRLHGQNTDLHGIHRSLEGVRLEDAEVVLVGAGGAARPAAYALRRAGVRRLTILTRDPAKGRRLADQLFPGAEIGALASEPAGDLLVNATPLGMAGQPWPRLPLGGLAPGAMVFDMVYAPARTELLVDAHARGFRTVGGATMLLFQAAQAFATFFGKPAPIDLGDGLVEQLTA
ncbi:shikimate dehydrogenase family protein [Sphingomonas astaxanthinifaciens]|uniref:Shikimate dehydrogenase (NADP(+)) n=1 Tax=Sphingomonas astaxanthinifaciens DSM 22298 TaxID=1123267 RepID=A0ABQ5Z7L3_9SPHN|nr:shikimate dehydrogenase [Sphingomonas astaxanthinifaciens]GLR46764.1 shikimate dehydrogenase (NADP(+)) [Sphingomonas astaxanthinifaciens DSM 22298]